MDALTTHIKAHWRNLNLIKLYEDHIDVEDRDSAETRVKGCLYDMVDTEIEASPLHRWCKDHIADDFQFLRTEEAMLYWSARLQAARDATKDVWSIENIFANEKIMQKRKVTAFNNIIENVSTSTEPATSSTRSTSFFSAISSENDEILFGRKSPGTIIKNYASSLINNFKNLDDKAKYIVGLSANGILNLSDTSGESQYFLFSEQEWDTLKRKYSKIPKLHKSKTMSNNLNPINKAMKNNDLKKAYRVARTLEVDNLDSETEIIYSIYAHIINVYRKRRSILNKNKTDSTEWDAFGKLWCEIIELLVGDEDIYIKWGESISDSSKEEMNNAGITKKIIGYKIDCRGISNVEDIEHDLINCEAARYLNAKKVRDDRLKLLIETRCNIDRLISTCPTADPTKIYMHYLQICGNKCDVGILRLVGPGLYISEKVGSLDIPMSVSEFGDRSVRWFTQLLLIKKNLCRLKVLTMETEEDKRGSFDRFFTDADETPVSFNIYCDWLRQYFFPPTRPEDPLNIPTNIYIPTVHYIEQRKRKISAQANHSKNKKR